MIKVDYEGAWEDLKNKTSYSEILDYDKALGFSIHRPDLVTVMNKLEQKHTHNYVDIRRRTDKEVADYCLKKYADMYLELVNLKNRLKKLSKGRKGNG